MLKIITVYWLTVWLSHWLTDLLIQINKSMYIKKCQVHCVEFNNIYVSYYTLKFWWSCEFLRQVDTFLVTKNPGDVIESPVFKLKLFIGSEGFQGFSSSSSTVYLMTIHLFKLLFTHHSIARLNLAWATQSVFK
jgi:hypothetical protein